MVHLEFIEHQTKKYGRTDYTFIDRHTSEEIAFGSYNNEGDFEVLSHRDGGLKRYICAAVAWTKLNRQLEEQYGY